MRTSVGSRIILAARLWRDIFRVFTVTVARDAGILQQVSTVPVRHAVDRDFSTSAIRNDRRNASKITEVLVGHRRGVWREGRPGSSSIFYEEGEGDFCSHVSVPSTKP